MKQTLMKSLGILLVLLAACDPHFAAPRSQQLVEPPSPPLEVKEYWEH